MPTYRDEAVVLRTHQLGEADRIISLLTRRHGKVRAVARGVRRTSSKFGARLEPFSHVDVQFAEGRGALEVVTQAETLHPGLLGLDYDRFTGGQVLVETADRLVTEDGVPSPAQYRLLLGALLALGRPGLPTDAVVDSYLLRALALAGYALVLDACASCGVTDALGWFSPQAGGALCATCRKPSDPRAGAQVLFHLGALQEGRWDDVARGDASVVRTCHGLVASHASWHLDRGLRSLAYLQR